MQYSSNIILLFHSLWQFANNILSKNWKNITIIKHIIMPLGNYSDLLTEKILDIF